MYDEESEKRWMAEVERCVEEGCTPDPKLRPDPKNKLTRCEAR